MEEKEELWSELDEVVEERVAIGYVDEGNRGDEVVVGRYDIKERMWKAR